MLLLRDISPELLSYGLQEPSMNFPLACFSLDVAPLIYDKLDSSHDELFGVVCTTKDPTLCIIPTRSSVSPK